MTYLSILGGGRIKQQAKNSQLAIMKRLEAKIERVVRDIWFKYLIAIAVYLLLFTVLLNLSERSYTLSAALFLLSIIVVQDNFR